MVTLNGPLFMVGLKIVIEQHNCFLRGHGPPPILGSVRSLGFEYYKALPRQMRILLFGGDAESTYKSSSERNRLMLRILVEMRNKKGGAISDPALKEET